MEPEQEREAGSCCEFSVSSGKPRKDFKWSLTLCFKESTAGKMVKD